ncbi:MAG: TIM barrel protein [Candidatus Solibacter usitatus]|nr:TIM barrel protein [Candidatus Solibacter usitatus]
MTRKDFLFSASAATAAALSAQETEPKVQRKNRLKQGVCGGVFGRGMSMEDRARHAARLGAHCFDLQGPDNWPILKKYGLVPTMVSGGGKLTDACNDPSLHDAIRKQFAENIPRAKREGIPNVITFSGNRRGKSDAEGLDNCYTVLKDVVKIAEDNEVTICMELLNSKVDHKDYQCDHTAWGVELCKRVNSPRFKLLYDIYHMQIMEGDIIRTIRQNFSYIGHFHTAGNPGRHQFDDTQEMSYKAIAQAIVDLGYTGYLCHEYSPTTPDPLKTLDEMMRICDV